MLKNRAEAWRPEASPGWAGDMDPTVSNPGQRARRRANSTPTNSSADAKNDTAPAPPGTVEQPPNRFSALTLSGSWSEGGGSSFGIRSQLPSQLMQRVPLGQRVHRHGSSTQIPPAQRLVPLHCFSSGKPWQSASGTQRFCVVSHTKPAPQKYGQGYGAQVPLSQRVPLGHPFIQALRQMPGVVPSL